MRLLILSTALMLSVQQHNAATTDAAPQIGAALNSIIPGELRRHLEVLASDEFEGRQPGTRGERLTVDYLVAQFKAAGLQPGNPDGTFVQRVPLVAYVSRPALSIASKGLTRQLRYPDDYVARSRRMVRSSRVADSALVFVGFGIDAPEFGRNDYEGLDVRGKTLVMLEGEPRFRATSTYYGTRHYKYDAAASRGAAAVFFVHDPATSSVPFQQLQARFDRESFELMPARPSDRVDVDGWLSAAAFERIAADAGQDPAGLRHGASRDDFRPVDLNAAATIDVTTELRPFESANVVARLEGSDERLRSEYVIYSAHWDHLGRNPALTGDQIHNGAIDNAAGTAQLLEIAEGFAALDRAPRRSILFIATTAEEVGYLGALHYTEHPLFPLASAVANINLDAGNVWGSTTDVINMAFGFTSLDGVLAAAAARQGRTFIGEPFAGGSYFFLSDQFMFARAGIPSVFPAAGVAYVGKPPGFGDQKWADYGKRYHTVSDEIESDWDLSGAAEDARWLLDAGYAVAQDDAVPSWNPDVEFHRPGTAPARQSAAPPIVTPLFLSREVEQSPAFLVECRNTTLVPISSGSGRWARTRSAISIDGAVLEDQGEVGGGLSMDIPPGATWRGIIELRQADVRTGFAVALGAHTRMMVIAPLSQGAHTISVRCAGVWSPDLSFFLEK
jgi:Zn-dependent M28 family amino/carboxypeptidase